MARLIEKLTHLGISKLKQPGYYGDGAGLWLQVSASGSKSWIFRYTIAGRQREMGIGALLSRPCKTPKTPTGRRFSLEIYPRNPREIKILGIET